MTQQPHSSGASSVADAVSGAAAGLGGWGALRRKVMPWMQVVGFLLLALAVYMVVRQHDASGRNLLAASWSSLKAAPAWQIVAVVASPLLNWLLVTLLFYVLTRHTAKNVRPGEMAALIGSAWLLNIIPGRPGLMGRVAYHTVVNHMPVKESVKVIIVGVVANGVALALALVLVGAAYMGGQMLPPGLAAEATPKFLTLGAAATLALLLSLAWFQRTGKGGSTAPIAAWRFVFAVAMRYADYLVWVGRYWLAFNVIGLPISLTEAAGIAVVSQVIQLSPAQLGIREWAVGIAGTALPSLRSLASVRTTPATGLTADLLCRAAELAVQLPVGLVCTWWVFRELRRAHSNEPRAEATGR